MVGLQRENLQDLTDLKQAGHGDFIHGVISGIETVAEESASEAGKLWHALTKSAISVMNDTTQVADSLVEDVTSFFKSPHSIFGIILLLGELGIVVYLWFAHVRRNGPPALPPRNYRTDCRREREEEHITVL